MVRGHEGVTAATRFYREALGLAVQRVTEEWAELHAHADGGGITVHLQATYAEPSLSTGYSPVLTFEVADMDQTIAACAQAGGASLCALSGCVPSASAVAAACCRCSLDWCLFAFSACA